MSENENIITGTPPLVMMAAKEYFFRVKDEHYIITVPRKGKYADLAPEIFDENSGEFNIYDEDKNILFMPSITKILFATGKYPDLNFNQFFVPYTLKFDEETVDIIGQVIDMVLPAKKDEE